MITINDTIVSFLSERNEGKFYDSSVTTYKRKLEVFFEYLINKCGLNDSNYEDMLRGMANDRIVKSIEYYVDEYNIKFKVTAELFFIVIKCYFDFISTKYSLKNENFDSNQKYKKLKDLVDNRIKEFKLDNSKQKSPIVREVFDKLNKLCNKKINTLNKDDLIKNQLVNEDSYNKPLGNFISSIIVKTIMLTGIKNQVVSRILLKDLDTTLNRLKINNYWIHLPNELGMQFKKYLDIRNDIVKDKSLEYPLFINKQGLPIGNDYTFMFEAIKLVVGNKKAECVSKFTIINMIKKGINSSIILEFTSFGLDTYLHCQELVNEEKSKEDLESKSRYLDSKIRSMEIFDKL